MESDPDGLTEKVAVVFKGEVIRKAGLKKSSHADVEGKVFDELCSLKKHKLRDDVRELAKKIAIEVKDKKFVATVDWLDDFMNRFSLSRKKDATPAGLKIKGRQRSSRLRNQGDDKGDEIEESKNNDDKATEKSIVNGSNSDELDKTKSDGEVSEPKSLRARIKKSKTSEILNSKDESSVENGNNSEMENGRSSLRKLSDKSDKDVNEDAKRVENENSSSDDKKMKSISKNKKEGSDSLKGISEESDEKDVDGEKTIIFDSDEDKSMNNEVDDGKCNGSENSDIVKDIEGEETIIYDSDDLSGGENKKSKKCENDSAKADSEVEKSNTGDEKGEVSKKFDEISDGEKKSCKNTGSKKNKKLEDQNVDLDSSVVSVNDTAKENEEEMDIVDASPLGKQAFSRKDKISSPGVRPRIKGKGLLRRNFDSTLSPEKGTVTEKDSRDVCDTTKKVLNSENDENEKDETKLLESSSEKSNKGDENLDKTSGVIDPDVDPLEIDEVSKSSDNVSDEVKDKDESKSPTKDASAVVAEDDSKSDSEAKEEKNLSEDSDIMIVSSEEEKEPENTNLYKLENEECDGDASKKSEESKIGKIFIRKIGLFYDDERKKSPEKIKSPEKAKSSEKARESKKASKKIESSDNESEDERSKRRKRRRSSVCKESISDENGSSNEAEEEDSLMSVSVSEAEEPSINIISGESDGNESDVVKKSKTWSDKNLVEYTKKEDKYYQKHQSDLVRRLNEKVTQCTACFNQVNHLLQEEVFTHKHLGVLICRKCYKFYGKGDFQKDDEGFDEYCRWCANGGDLLLCEACMNGFCRKCIKRNLGRTAEQIAAESDDWKCYRCDMKPMTEVRALHRAILEGLETSEVVKKSFSRTESNVSKMKDKFNALKVKRKVLGYDNKPKITTKIKKEPIPEWFKSGVSDMTELIEKCTEQVDKMENLLKNSKLDSKEAQEKTSRRFIRLTEAMGENFKTLSQKIKEESAFEMGDQVEPKKDEIKMEKKEKNIEDEKEAEKKLSDSGNSGKKKVLKKRLRGRGRSNEETESDEETPTKLSPPRKRKKKRGSISDGNEKSENSNDDQKSAKKEQSDNNSDKEVKSKKKDKPSIEADAKHPSPENAEDDLSDINLMDSSQASLKAIEKLLDISLIEKNGRENKSASESEDFSDSTKADDGKKCKVTGKSKNHSNKSSVDDNEKEKCKIKAGDSSNEGKILKDESRSDNEVSSDDDKLKMKKSVKTDSDDYTKDVKKSKLKKVVPKSSDELSDDNKKSRGKKVVSRSSDDSSDDEKESKGKKVDKNALKVKNAADLLSELSSEDDSSTDDNISSDDSRKKRKGRKKKPAKSKKDKTNKDAMNDLLSSDSDSDKKPNKRSTRTKGKKADADSGLRKSKRKRKESEGSLKSKSKRKKKGSSDSTGESEDEIENILKGSNSAKNSGKKSKNNTGAKESLLNDSSDSDKSESSDINLSKLSKKNKEKKKKMTAEEKRELKDSMSYKPRPKSIQDSRQKNQLDQTVSIDVDRLDKSTEDTLKEKGFIVFQKIGSAEEGDGITKFKMHSDDSSDEELSSLISKFKLRKKATTSTSQTSETNKSSNDTDDDADSLNSDDGEKKLKKKRSKDGEGTKKKNKKEGLMDISLDEDEDDDDKDKEKEESDEACQENKKDKEKNDKSKRALLSSSGEEGDDSDANENDGSGSDVLDKKINEEAEAERRKKYEERKKKAEERRKEEEKEKDDSDESEGSVKKKGKKGYINMNFSSDDDEEDDKSKKDKATADTSEESDEESSDFETPRKNRMFLDSEDSDSNKKSKKKKKTKVFTSSDEDSESSGGGKSKKKARKRIKKSASSDDGEEGEGEGEDGSKESPNKKRRRHIIRDEDLTQKTKDATQEESDRRTRVEDRQKLYNKIFEFDVESDQPDKKKLVLDFDSESKKELVAVHEKIANVLKPHQFEGIKFMWQASIEDLERLQNGDKGGGCILAHCMGLGKTLQVIAFVHTLLTSRKCNDQISRIMICCPVNTVYNWVAEFKIWLKGKLMPFDVVELISARDLWGRAYRLDDWFKEGGVLIIGYDMYRNLSSANNKRYKGKMMSIFQETLVNPGPDLVVCDEGHILKNEKTSLSIAINKVKTFRRIVLTGTPLQNNLKEYHCMIQFVKPNLLGTKKEFMNRFVNPIMNGQCADAMPKDVRRMKRRAHILHNLLEGCVQRYDYTVLKPFLPPKYEYVISIQMSAIQCKLYSYYLMNLAQGGPKRIGSGLFVDFNNLASVWNHPKVLDLAMQRRLLQDDDDEMEEFICDGTTSEDDFSSSDSENPKKKKKKKKDKEKKESSDVETPPPEDPLEDPMTDGLTKSGKIKPDWWRKVMGDICDGDETEEDVLNKFEISGKLVLLFEILRECSSIGDKVLLFSQSILALNMIEEFLSLMDKGEIELAPLDDLDKHIRYKHWKVERDYIRLDGSTSADTRKVQCSYFNNPNNERVRLFLISTRAGGIGINLIGANRVIVFDQSWNPSNDTQSIFRIYRFGQKKPCYIYRFVAQGTMEEKIYSRQVTKISTALRVVDEHQIKRYFNMADLSTLYEFTPADEDTREVPQVPEDRLFAELLIRNKNWIVNYHEQDSLLENQTQEELTEEERKAAWEDFENEKKGLVPMENKAISGNVGHIMPFNVQSIIRTIHAQNPSATPTQLQQSILMTTQNLLNAHRTTHHKLQQILQIMKNPAISPDVVLPYGNSPEAILRTEGQINLLKTNIQEEFKVIRQLSSLPHVAADPLMAPNQHYGAQRYPQPAASSQYAQYNQYGQYSNTSNHTPNPAIYNRPAASYQSVNGDKNSSNLNESDDIVTLD